MVAESPGPVVAGNGARAANDAGKAIRFEFVEMSYGCHERRVDIPIADAPFVICGPNGSGKTTILEALVRTLFGFRRRRPKDRSTAEARRPWTAEAFEATTGLVGPEGRYTFRRDFESDEVVVRHEGDERPVFEGEANLSGSGTGTRQYRGLLQAVLGLSELDHYERTACVYQGGLVETELNEDLLRIAAGGHADIETAKGSLRDEYAALTIDPIAEGESKRRKPGEVEKIAKDVERLEGQLEEARSAEARRTPLARERDEARTRLASVDERVAALEEAFERATEVERLETARRASEERLGQLESLTRELDEAIARVGLLAERKLEPVAERYPVDFPERVAALEEGLWPRERELAAERDRLRALLAASATPPGWRIAASLAIGLVSFLIAVLVVAAGSALLGAAPLLAGLAAVSFAIRDWRTTKAHRLHSEEVSRIAEELASIVERIDRKLDGLPDAETLTVQTLPDRRREFERQRSAVREREAAEYSLRQVMDRVRATLDRVEVWESESQADAEEPSRPEATTHVAGPLMHRARDLLDRLHSAVSDERNKRLAPVLLKLREASRRHLELPDGVPADLAELRAALQAARDEGRRLSESLAALERRLAYEGRPEESSVALNARLKERQGDLAELRERAAAYRHAFRLVTDAYDEFRQSDQSRLVDAVSGHLSSVTYGELGPLSTTDGLDTVRLRAGDRTLPLESPPLSYGQYHSAMFAIRLGAADFLAGLGVRVPLLIDDPFVHLDDERAAELWEVLQRIARHRQVVVATQDRLLLDYLGVDPDLSLYREPDGSRRATAAEPDGSRPTTATEPADPDLWSFLPESDERPSGDG